MRFIYSVIRKIIYRPAKTLALLYQRYLDWKYKWDGRKRARFYRLILADCGSHFKMNGKATIYTPQKVHIGSHFIINNGCQIAPRGEVYIGDYVTMSRGSQITAGSLDSKYWIDEQYKNHIHTKGDVYIGDGTWLCINSIVLPGVKITGKGVIVAAGSVVTHDISDDYVVVGGIPAHIVKRLKDTDVQKTPEKEEGEGFNDC